MLKGKDPGGLWAEDWLGLTWGLKSGCWLGIDYFMGMEGTAQK